MYDERSHLNELLLDSVLRHDNVDNSLLAVMFGNLHPQITRMIEDFWSENVLGAHIRFPVYNPRKVEQARMKADGDLRLAELDYFINNKKNPGMDLAEYVYTSKHACTTMTNYDLLNRYTKDRECGTSCASHGHNLAGTSKHLEADAIHIATCGNHDVVEELFRYANQIYGLKEGLANFNNFTKHIIPDDELRSHVLAVTNLNDTIISAVDEFLFKKGKSFNKKNSTAAISSLGIEDLGEADPAQDSLTQALWQNYAFAVELDDSKDFRARLKWQGYLAYMGNIAQACQQMGNYTPFDVKGLDLYYNGLGKEALNLDSRIKNALKKQSYVNAYERYIRTDFQPVKERVDEICETNRHDTRNLIMKDFDPGPHPMTRFKSALYKIKRLSPVLYADPVHMSMSDSKSMAHLVP